MTKVLSFPSAFAPPPRAAGARPFITELDAALMLHADFGSDEGELRYWTQDRPVVASELAAALAEFAAAPEDDIPRRSALLRDMATQMKVQSDAFGMASTAILMMDTRRLGTDANGTGTAEAKRLIELGIELLAADGVTSPDLRKAIKSQLEDTAAAFLWAGNACREWADAIHAARDAKYGDRLAQRLATLAEEQRISRERAS